MHRADLTTGAGGAGEAWLVYDGECPFCSAYVRYVRLRDAIGRLHLVDARAGGPIVERIAAAGYDLNEGMALKLGERIYHGADCIHMLSALSTRSGAFNRVNALLFGSPTLARWLYPVLRAGRNVVLRALGRRRIEGSRRSG